jgi:hypothetical protein
MQVGSVPGAGLDFTSLNVEWMRCANPGCQQAVVRMHELHSQVEDGEQTNWVDTWIARPRGDSRPIDPLVSDPIRTDYLEAAAILDISPRMSAVLSRRILADLLEQHAGQTQFSLEGRVDGFVQDDSHPSYLRENLHHLREIANFGAHTQKDVRSEIIDVDRDEAEWTLDILDSLFDYFIVAPERNRAIREQFDKKIDAAGRKPLKPPPT